MIDVNPKFNIMDTVYHICPESDPGVILNIKYDFGAGRYEYLVAIGWGEERIVWESELSRSKTFK